MTLFTDNPFEKMMIQKPDGRRDNAPPYKQENVMSTRQTDKSVRYCPVYSTF